MLTQAVDELGVRTQPQLALLPHAAPVLLDLVTAWPEGASRPHEIAPLLDTAARFARRVTAAVVSEPRSGSTSFAKVSTPSVGLRLTCHMLRGREGGACAQHKEEGVCVAQ